MVAQSGFSWEVSPREAMGPQVHRAIIQLPRMVLAAMRVVGVTIHQEAQANAPWNDITGFARAGLSINVSRDGALITLTLYHTMYYGIYLELRWGGRYAIIMPTLQANYGNIMTAVRDALGRIWR